MNETAQKVALVTGGNRGIGEAIVAGLANQGMKVLLACRDMNAGIRTAQKLSGDIEVVALDLTDTGVLGQNIQTIAEQYPHIDILVNNAGVLEEGNFSQMSHSAFANSMQVNAMAAFELIQFFAGRMESRGYGRVVNVSSGWGAFSDGLTGPAAYSISKATLNAITLTAANSYRRVKVNALCPGWVRTRMGGMAATRSAAKGAETAIWLAMLDESGPTGRFFRDMKQIDW